MIDQEPDIAKNYHDQLDTKSLTLNKYLKRTPNGLGILLFEYCEYHDWRSNV